MSTYTPKPGEIAANWHVVDATDQVLGRLAAKVAVILQGKHKPTYTPHVDTGDFVIIVNAEKVSMSGNKPERTFYYRHSGYPGGLRVRSLGDMLRRHPERVVEKAIVGMLPKTKLGRQMKTKLRVYAGPDHPHAAQQPVPYEIKQVTQ